jgi:hypothetical protein
LGGRFINASGAWRGEAANVYLRLDTVLVPRMLRSAPSFGVMRC